MPFSGSKKFFSFFVTKRTKKHFTYIEGLCGCVDDEKNRVFTEQYRSTCNHVLKYAVSRCGNVDDASDIVQKTYLNYYERVQKHGHVQGDPLPYLLKITNSELRKYYMFNSNRVNDIPVFSEIADDENFEAMEALLVQELPEDTRLDAQEIWQYIKNQDPLTARIFVLYFHHGETFSGIAKILNIGESNAKQKFYRTVVKLKEHFNLS